MKPCKEILLGVLGEHTLSNEKLVEYIEEYCTSVELYIKSNV